MTIIGLEMIMKDNNEKLKLLEHAIMNLSMQVAGLQSKLTENSSFKEEYYKTLEGLRNLLDEKGMISKEDFDSEIEIFQILKEGNLESMIESDLPKQKRKAPVH